MLDMVAGATLSTEAAPAQARDNVFIANAQVQDRVKGLIRLSEPCVQAFRLSLGAGKAVEHETAAAIVLGQPLRHQVEHDGIGHKLPGIDVLPSLVPDLRPLLHGLTQQFARGNMRHGEIVNQLLRLGSLTGARRAEKDQSHDVFRSQGAKVDRRASRPVNDPKTVTRSVGEEQIFRGIRRNQPPRSRFGLLFSWRLAAIH